MSSIKVTRDSVCAADDQTNPLTLTIQVPGSESLQSLVTRIIYRNFLQFSSSHSTITGFVSGQPIVRVHANFSSGHQAEFLISPTSSVESCLPDGLLEFEWAGSNNSPRDFPSIPFCRAAAAGRNSA
ncbi:hypothetical protein [Thauera sp.]|uniref:hypothetical protein n=1 Tax=Thauera sp. TaxID=1905334 RepID=UPI0039E4FA33